MLINILLIPVALCCELVVLYQSKVNKHISGNFILLNGVTINSDVSIDRLRAVSLFNCLINVKNGEGEKVVEIIKTKNNGRFHQFEIVNLWWWTC